MMPSPVSAPCARRSFGATFLVFVVASAGMTAPAFAQAPAKPAKPAPAARAPVYFPDRFDWQKRSPADAGMDAVTTERGRAVRRREREPRDEGPGGRSRHDVRRPRALRHADRARPGARRRERPHHPPGLRGRRMGRHRARGHDVQRDEDVSLDGGRPGLAEGPHPRRHRSRARLHAASPAISSGHNATITWEHLLRQTSDWQGTLWGKPDWADRPEGADAGRLAEPEAAPRRARATSTTTRA